MKRKMDMLNTEDLIESVCDDIKEILVLKNRKYGDSAISPVSIFYKGNNLDGIRVRIDDKLSRIANQQIDEDEDAELDLIGYLILYRVAKIKSKENDN